MIKDSNSRQRRAFRLGTAVAFAAVLLAPSLAAAAPGSATDPDDVTLRLDLKTVSHSDDGSTITLTSQTYEPFKDEWADFKWGIDKDGDESFDLLVFAEWDEGELAGGVDDSAEEPVSLAQVTRPGPDSIAVTFSSKILGKATSYRYGALAATDLNGNGEEDAGETDLAPNTGLYTHELSTTAPAASPAPAKATAAPAPKPAAAPQPGTTAKADTTARPAVSPKPEPAPAAAAEPTRKPAAAAAPKPAPVAAAKPTPAAAKIAPAPAVKPAPAPAVKPAPAPEATAMPAVNDPASKPSPAPNPALARTGPLTDILLILAGLVLLAGGTFIVLEGLLPRTARR